MPTTADPTITTKEEEDGSSAAVLLEDERLGTLGWICVLVLGFDAFVLVWFVSAIPTLDVWSHSARSPGDVAGVIIMGVAVVAITYAMGWRRPAEDDLLRSLWYCGLFNTIGITIGLAEPTIWGVGVGMSLCACFRVSSPWFLRSLYRAWSPFAFAIALRTCTLARTIGMLAAVLVYGLVQSESSPRIRAARLLYLVAVAVYAALTIASGTALLWKLKHPAAAEPWGPYPNSIRRLRSSASIVDLLHTMTLRVDGLSHALDPLWRALKAMRVCGTVSHCCFIALDRFAVLLLAWLFARSQTLPTSSWLDTHTSTDNFPGWIASAWVVAVVTFTFGSFVPAWRYILHRLTASSSLATVVGSLLFLAILFSALMGTSAVSFCCVFVGYACMNVLLSTTPALHVMRAAVLSSDLQRQVTHRDEDASSTLTARRPSAPAPRQVPFDLFVLSDISELVTCLVFASTVQFTTVGLMVEALLAVSFSALACMVIAMQTYTLDLAITVADTVVTSSSARSKPAPPATWKSFRQWHLERCWPDPAHVEGLVWQYGQDVFCGCRHDARAAASSSASSFSRATHRYAMLDSVTTATTATSISTSAAAAAAGPETVGFPITAIVNGQDLTRAGSLRVDRDPDGSVSVSCDPIAPAAVGSAPRTQRFTVDDDIRPSAAPPLLPPPPTGLTTASVFPLSSVAGSDVGLPSEPLDPLNYPVPLPL